MNDSKVAPVEAQAVPDQPVAEVVSWTNGSYSRNYKLRWLKDVPEGTQLFTRPTPAAADLHQQIMNLPLPTGWDKASALGSFGLTEAEKLAYKIGHRDARHAAAELVAASPAAAAGVPTGRALPKPSTEEVSKALDAMLAEYDFPCNSKNAARAGWEAANRWLLAASPVAPVGAPTDEREALRDLLDAIEAFDGKTFAFANKIERVTAARTRARALLSRQGCELATDATKQLGEHSVHLAMSTSSVPTAAPLSSPCETDRSELPRDVEVSKSQREGEIMSWQLIHSERDGGWAVERIHPDEEGQCSRILFMGKDDEELARSFVGLQQIDREELADFYKWKSGKAVHSNLCATSVAPAMIPGPCDCNAWKTEERCETDRSALPLLLRIDQDAESGWWKIEGPLGSGLLIAHPSLDVCVADILPSWRGMAKLSPSQVPPVPSDESAVSTKAKP